MERKYARNDPRSLEFVYREYYERRTYIRSGNC